MAFLFLPEIHANNSFLLFSFPQDSRKIARLSYDHKMEWYAYQFQKNAQEATVNFSSPEFKRFWKWNVAIPLQIKRFLCRVKTGQIFKHYSPITEMREKVRKFSI